MELPSSFHHTTNTVCVMDAAGQLGSSLVERLLERGYTVHAAIQNHGTGELQKLEGICISDEKKKRMKIFHSDPFDYQSIMEALKGCFGLFYTYQPPQDQVAYDENAAEIEVRTAHNVLEACAQTETIDKVVFTSSATAIAWTNDRKSTSMDLDERHWSDINFCQKSKLWHALAKTLAEKTAWALAMDRGVDMVSINPGLVMSPTTNLTINNPYLKGAAEMYEDGVFVTVDLNYLVDTHICVYENISTYGRYLCFNQVVNRPEDAIKLVQMMTPGISPTLEKYKEEKSIIRQRISNKKLNKLMVDCLSGLQSA